MERHSTRVDGTQDTHAGQSDPDQSSVITLGYLAETLLASQELWADLPGAGPLFGAEFLDAVLQGAGDGS